MKNTGKIYVHQKSMTFNHHHFICAKFTYLNVIPINYFSVLLEIKTFLANCRGYFYGQNHEYSIALQNNFTEST